MPPTYELAGLEVPRIGLGTNRLTDDPDGVAFVQAAVEAGVRHIDSAHLYTGGASERAIGKALGGGRDDLVIATKGGYNPGEGRPEVLDAQIAQSLEALGTDVIDLYYLHRVDPETPLEESLGAIKAHVDRGTICAVGISDVSVEQVERAQQILPIAAVQNEYNVERRDYDEVIDHCEARGIAFVAYYPLNGPGSNAEKLRSLLDRSPNLLPIPGTRSVDHLRENLAVLDASSRWGRSDARER
jgi:pyridoxine 4-dehydrogenase